MPIKTIGIVGAGQMGLGIAQVSSQAGFQVILLDSSKSALDSAQKKIYDSLNKLKSKNLIDNLESITQNISYSNNLNLLQQADFVIEAIIENIEAKKALFLKLDELVPKTTILASNTSSISITSLASSTKRPEKFIGMHFMNPVPIMKLVEIIRGHFTSESTLLATKEIALNMGKIVTISQDYPGFIANRILMPMINEAFYALMQNIGSAEDIDTTMKLGCNFPMGPLALADFIGLDTCLAILEILHKELGEDKYAPCPLLKKLVLAKSLGKKTGQGVFSY